ncbi:hypothetical protein [Cerasicoccus arenae]|uniref:Uncharacterized protein n=1 Tax=Cerasicoccus arenae TaxID=424488 RepID=A0A8J3DG47_9BACT|nr:hypothetical protein [Cerasicoccus arenae]MBK1858850.1 hypothetical protein [Cerasicoccus arenae]GHB96035.1 hypothetical protein GCM10007047_09700 [Cerasicoccus arenae]
MDSHCDVMLRFICLFTILTALIGCTATEKDMWSTKPMSESTGDTLGELNQRQTNVVDGMDEQGQLNSYEEKQMDEAIDGK